MECLCVQALPSAVSSGSDPLSQPDLCFEETAITPRTIPAQDLLWRRNTSEMLVRCYQARKNVKYLMQLFWHFSLLLCKLVALQHNGKTQPSAQILQGRAEYLQRYFCFCSVRHKKKADIYEPLALFKKKKKKIAVSDTHLLLITK